MTVKDNYVSMQAKRLAVIDNFFTHHDQSTLDSILADDAQIIEQGAKVRTYNKSEWVNLVTNHVVPAIPNFNWGHKTDGSKDDDGYSVVTVQVRLLAAAAAWRHLAIAGSFLPACVWHSGNRKTFRKGLPHTWLRVAKGNSRH